MDFWTFSKNNIMLLKQISSKKSLTSREQTIYGGLAYYGAIKFLEKHKLVKIIGKDDKGYNVYKSTDKGKIVIGNITKINEVLNEE